MRILKTNFERIRKRTLSEYKIFYNIEMTTKDKTVGIRVNETVNQFLKKRS